MAVFQIVSGGVVVNTILVQDGSTLADNAITTPDGSVLAAPAGSEYMSQPGAAISWTLAAGVLSAPPPVIPVLTKEQLIDHANRAQWGLATSGHNVTVGGASYLFPTDTDSLSLMTSKVVRLQMTGAPTSVDWQLPSGYVTFSASDFIVAAISIADWVQSTFEALRPVLAAISKGTITTQAQIDAASWPTP
jgi:hypothetical protein